MDGEKKDHFANRSQLADLKLICDSERSIDALNEMTWLL